MLSVLIYSMIYLGAGLMVYNIHAFVQFGRYFNSLNDWGGGAVLTTIPVVLLTMFLLGYIGVGLFVEPDLLVAAILFFGSIFVFVMHVILRNITQKVVENERLKAELLAAEQSSREKTTFLASVSHEMRTPMNVIIGLDNIALKRADLAPDTREHLLKIGLSARHLLGLINNILDMNSIVSGELRVKQEEFLLDDMCNQLDALLGMLCLEKGLTWRFTIHDEARGLYLGDEMLLKQVLISILDNAKKYTDSPGVVTFDVSCKDASEQAKTLVFTVTDTGVGMTPEFMTNLFKPFAQEDASSTSRYGGSGLSLSVAKHIIENMEGAIEATSTKGKGSTFVVTVTLPVVVHESAVEDEYDDGELLSGLCVLVVEDIDENAEIVCDLLELEGADSERAENGRIAVEMFSESEPDHFDAILMDLRMPEMDGLEATRRIRALDRPDAQTVPIIAVTANAFDSDVEECLDAGMDEHLAKPADADALYATLRRLTNRSAA